MKKMFFITLCVLLMLSVAVVSAQEVITEDAPQFSRENMPQRGRFNPENIPQGERPQFNPDGASVGEIPQRQQNAIPVEETAQPTPPETSPEENSQNFSQFPDGMQQPRGGMQWEEQQQESEEPMTFFRFITTYSTPIISVLLLGLAFIFVIFYKRKNY